MGAGAGAGEGISVDARRISVDAGEEADDQQLFRCAMLEAAAAREAKAAGPPKAAFLFLTNSDLTFAPL